MPNEADISRGSDHFHGDILSTHGRGRGGDGRRGWSRAKS